MSDMPWKLAGYLVERLLGQGGSGQIWRARTSAGEPVALKRIPFVDADQIRAAQAEAALLGTLDHPHLIRLHDLVPTADAVVLVLDLATGGSLAELLAARGRLTPGEVITALAPIGAALSYAHGAGVVHGDVTPANVLFTEAGLPLLADLGVARLLGDREPVHSTPAYLDPAVAAGAVPGPQSDVFMLGAVALHTLTGAPPWSGDGAEQAMAAARVGRLSDVPDRLAAAGVPAAIAAVVHRALLIEPAHRGTAADFALELRHAGEPAPVELAAGRARVEPSIGGLVEDARSTGTPQRTTEPGRPSFDRPLGARHSVGTAAHTSAAVYTHAVGPRPRPVRGRRRAKRRPLWDRRYARWVAAAGCAVALAAGAGVAWSQFGGGRSAPLPSASTAAGVDALPVVSAGAMSSTAGATTVSTTSTGTPSAAAAAAALVQLDALRERAFERRAPLLLNGVYVPGPLLDQDTALLTKIVPSGCGLDGVHTTYSQVNVLSSHGDTLEVSTQATLSQSLLVCAGTAKGTAAGSPATPLRIVLVKKRTGYLISAITR
jgi:hypothetical protein